MKHVGIGLVHLYRRTLGVFMSGRCKYHPSCSQYAIDAFRTHGLFRGFVLVGWRLARCNPWSYGGVDYAEDQSLFGSRPAPPPGSRIRVVAPTAAPPPGRARPR